MHIIEYDTYKGSDNKGSVSEALYSDFTSKQDYRFKKGPKII